MATRAKTKKLRDSARKLHDEGVSAEDISKSIGRSVRRVKEYLMGKSGVNWSTPEGKYIPLDP